MRGIHGWSSLLGVFLATLSACAEDAPAPGERDAGALRGDAAWADAIVEVPDAQPADLGLGLDATALLDAVSPVDALAADVAPGADAAPIGDATPEADAASPNDAGDFADATPTPDGASSSDASTADTGPPSDGGAVDRIYARWPMPDSLTVYCSSGTAPITCPAAGAVAYGQDGNHRGPLPAYNTTADTITDSVTGLMWQRSGLPSARAFADAVSFCDALSLGGFDDWHLPTAIELTSLADLGDQNGALDPATFPGFGVATYWSSTQYADYAPNKWAVDLGAGYRENQSIARQNSVVCARAGSNVAGPRYTIATEVATDNATGLAWQRGSSTATLTWLDALAYCQSLSLGGFDDWRLPSLKELNTIFDDARVRPAIDEAAFPGTPFTDTDYFWSSSPHFYYDNAAWAVKYQFGTTHAFFTDSPSANTGRARCVR